MTKLLVVFAAALVLAYISEQNTKAALASGHRYSVWNDLAYILLAVVLVLFAGLRTSYNDTWNYVNGFRNAPGLAEWFRNPDNLNPFKNPLFYFFQSLLKSYTSNTQWLIFRRARHRRALFLSFRKKDLTNRENYSILQKMR